MTVLPIGCAIGGAAIGGVAIGGVAIGIAIWLEARPVKRRRANAPEKPTPINHSRCRSVHYATL
jgi:hypothetical protein